MKVQNYLSNLQDGSGEEGDKKIIEAFFDSASKTLLRQLSNEPKRRFRLRASNLGRFGCVLQSEKMGVRRDPAPYSARFRNLYGDLIEAAALAVMKSAGVKVVDEQVAVKFPLLNDVFDGTLDVVIAEDEPKIYDVKSASGYAFTNKFLNKNLGNVFDEGDAFGYVTQLYCYSEGTSIPVGGIISVNKENGEWCIVEPPLLEDELREKALARAKENVKRIVNDEPFKKDFEPIKEVFRRKETGNLILGSACSFCDYKKNCWPTAEYLPDVNSKGANPRFKYYVERKSGKEVE